jgi:D-alanyl-D-alanine carboxypeptidase
LDEESNQISQGLVNCTTRISTGYADGEPFDITVVTVDGKPAEVLTANAYSVMQGAAAEDGVTLWVVSGFRTMEEQEYLYDCYVSCDCNNCNLAAPPGYSNHQSGHALDLNTSGTGVYAWLDANAAEYGFERTVPSEDWHWEWWGGGLGGGPCPVDESGPTALRLVGVVYDATAGTLAGIAAASVTLIQDGAPVGQVSTAPNGGWSIDVSAGTYGVITTATGFQRSERTVAVSGSGDQWSSVGLWPEGVVPTGVLYGVVFAGAQPDEDPIAGAQLVLSTGTGVQCGQDGTFRLDVPAGDVTLTATAEGYRSNSVSGRVVVGSSLWAAIHMERLSSPELSTPTPVSPRDGEEVSGANVVVTWTPVGSAGDVVTYEVEVVGQDGAVVAAQATASSVHEGTVSATLPGSLPAASFGWHVRATQAARISAWSVMATFRALGSDVSADDSDTVPDGGSARPMAPVGCSHVIPGGANRPQRAGSLWALPSEAAPAQASESRIPTEYQPPPLVLAVLWVLFLRARRQSTLNSRSSILGVTSTFRSSSS